MTFKSIINKLAENNYAIFKDIEKNVSIFYILGFMISNITLPQ
jgi:hypothetical protein